LRRAAVLAILVLPLAACGGSGKKSLTAADSASSASSVKQAAVKTAQSASEHMVVTGTATVGGTSATINGSGDFDNRTLQGAFKATLGAAGINFDMDEVVDGTTLYVRSPLFTKGLAAGKSWVKLDLQKFGKARGVDFSALLARSPVQALAQLEAVDGVTSVGEETIGGVPTTHYRGRVDVNKLPQKIKALTNAKYGPVEIWIGRDGFVHRYRMTTTISQSGQSVTTATTVDFSKYGESVTVNVPPASATVDGTNALEGSTS